MSQVKVEQQDYSAGMVRGVNPLEIDPRAVIDAINTLYERDGSAFRRGGTENYSGALGSTGLTYVRDDFYDAGQRTVIANDADFGVLDSTPSSTPLNLGSDGLAFPTVSALLNSMLFIGGGYIYGGSRKTAAYTTGTVSLTNGSKTVTGSGTTWDTLVDAGMLLQRGNERVYVVDSIDSTTQLTLRDAYEGATGTGISYSLNPLYKITAADPYPDSDFYFVCANRLCYAADHNVLGFSEVQAPHDQTVTIGGVSIDNQHPFPDGAELIGGVTIGQTAICFTTAGTYSVEGLAFDIVDDAGTTQHRVQLLSREIVLWSGPGVATWQQAAIVPTLGGVYLMDGVSAPRSISASVDELYRLYIAQGYRTGQAAVYRGHYFLPILNASGTRVMDTLVARLDRPVRSGGQVEFPWSRFAGTGGSMAGYAVRNSSTPAEPLLLGASRLSDSKVHECSPFFEPDAGHQTDGDGLTHEWVLVTREYPAGDLNENKVRSLRTRYELLDATDQLSTEAVWRMSASHSESDPGAGFFRMDLFDDVDQWPSEIYISQTDNHATDQALLLGSAVAGDSLVFRRDVDVSEYEITDTPTDHGTWWTVPVSFIQSFQGFVLGSDSAEDNDPITLRFVVAHVAPHIDFDYGFGRREEGGFMWDAFDWAIEAGDDPQDLYWEDDEDEEWFRLDCPAPPDNGASRHRCRVNKTARSMRFRLRCNQPAALLRLRSTEMFVRPSGANRT